MSKKVIILGASICAIYAAKKLRRLNEDLDILIIDNNSDFSVENNSLPYFISDIISDKEKLIYEYIDELQSWYNIKIKRDSSISSINSLDKYVTFTDGSGEIFTEDYDYLIAVPSGKIGKPDIAGINTTGIFMLNSLSEAEKAKVYISEKQIKSIVIVSESYKGIQLAESLKRKGKDIILIDFSKKQLLPFDDEFQAYIEQILANGNIKLIKNEEIISFSNIENEIFIKFKDDKQIITNMVIWCPAEKPDIEYFQNSGVAISTDGYVKVNNKMKTSVDNIYSIGNFIEITDPQNSTDDYIESENTYISQAATAAENICDVEAIFKKNKSSFAIKVLDITAAITGRTEINIKKSNTDYNVIHVNSYSHEPSYPNSTPVYLKLLFSPNGLILGAQAMGNEGPEKIIDIISTVMHLGGDVFALKDLEFCFSPPLSMQKAIINTAGYMAENVLKGFTSLAYSKEINNFDIEKQILLDVRSEQEYKTSHIHGAINIPLDNLRDTIMHLDKSKEIIVYCRTGVRGYAAQRILSQGGFYVKNLSGGYETYMLLNKSTQNSSQYEKDNDNITPKAFINDSNNVLKNLIPSAKLDACGLSCPGPLLKVSSLVSKLEDGDILKVIASDQGFYTDIKAWCQRTNNKLLNISTDKGIITAFIQKSKIASTKSADDEIDKAKDNKTLIIFSGDLDKALASFIIANGAASMGKKVTMFFTFWGLNIIRKPKRIKLKKGFLDKMFGIMMPRGSKKLTLSRLNMFGIGGKLIRKVMKSKNIYSLEELIETAVKNGVEIVACQMSMDVMGIRKEELIDSAKIAGVGYYIGETEDSNLNLFI